MPKAKKVNYEAIQPTDGPDEQAMYDLLLDLVGEHHKHLSEANFCLAWRKELKPDVDGKLVLGKCKKAGDLDRLLHDRDFIIVLNREAWGDLNADQREALLYHELCHAAVARDKDGAIKRDENDRIVYRIRKHDIEEFSSVVERYGLYKADLEAFAEAMAKKRSMPLFADVDEESATNGEASGDRPKRQRRARRGADA